MPDFNSCISFEFCLGIVKITIKKILILKKIMHISHPKIIFKSAKNMKSTVIKKLNVHFIIHSKNNFKFVKSGLFQNYFYDKAYYFRITSGF